MKKTSSKPSKATKTNVTTPVTDTPVETTEVVQEQSSTATLVGKPSVKNSRYIVLGILLIALATLLYYFRASFIAATVNGQPIWRKTVNEKLYKQYGQQTVDMLITEALIEQQAKVNGVDITPDKVASETAKIDETLKAQGQSLDQVLLLQGMDRAELERQLKLNLMVEQLAGAAASPSAQEIQAYITANEEVLPADLKGDQLNAYVTEMLTSQKKNESIQSWLGNLKQGAKIQTF